MFVFDPMWLNLYSSVFKYVSKTCLLIYLIYPTLTYYYLGHFYFDLISFSQIIFPNTKFIIFYWFIWRKIKICV
jgi:hypothetical protein